MDSRPWVGGSGVAPRAFVPSVRVAAMNWARQIPGIDNADALIAATKDIEALLRSWGGKQRRVRPELQELALSAAFTLLLRSEPDTGALQQFLTDAQTLLTALESAEVPQLAAGGL